MKQHLPPETMAAFRGLRHRLLLPSMGRRTKDEGWLYSALPVSTVCPQNPENPRNITFITMKQHLPPETMAAFRGLRHRLLLPSMGRRTKDEGWLYPALPVSTICPQNPENPRNNTFITMKQHLPPETMSAFRGLRHRLLLPSMGRRTKDEGWLYPALPVSTVCPQNPENPCNITFITMKQPLPPETMAAFRGLRHGLLLPSMGRRTKDEGWLYPALPVSTVCPQNPENPRNNTFYVSGPSFISPVHSCLFVVKTPAPFSLPHQSRLC